MKKDLLKALAAPFPAEKIHWRPGPKSNDKAIPLAYINARDVQKRLDDVCGVEWQCRYPWSDSKRLVCEIGVCVDGLWLWRANGAGDTQVEAEKGAFSDAFKRAAVMWGVGEYLYHMPNVWVPIQGNKFSDETIKNLTERLAAWQKNKFGESL